MKREGRKAAHDKYGSIKGSFPGADAPLAVVQIDHTLLDIMVVDEEMISKRLYTAGLPEPDLLIRTSGEMRISNFLLWQIAYAELYVTDTLWPDFNREELLRAILEFQRRERRFGGIAETVTEPADLTVAADFPDEETEEIAVSSQ